MSLQFNLFNVLILTSCVQGIILGALLFFVKNRARTHIFLAILLLAYSLNNLNAVFFDSGLSQQIPALLIFPFSLILAIGPALYLHTKFALRPETLWKNRYYLHFIPSVVEFAWYAGLSMYWWGRPKAILTFYQHYENAYSLPEQVTGILSVFVYLILTLRTLRWHRHQIKANFSAMIDVPYKHLRVLVAFLSASWLAWVILIAIDVTYYGYGLAQSVYYPLYIVMSVTIYVIGYAGYFRQVAVVDYAPQAEPIGPLQDPELQGLAKQLIAEMQTEKLYLDPTLRLKNVADRLQCSPQKLSMVLNGILQKNFYDFINEYRVEAVKERLSDPVHNQYTLVAVAFDCGFNSKSVFNDLFKKSTGKTPKEYKRWAQNNVRLTQTDRPAAPKS